MRQFNLAGDRAFSQAFELMVLSDKAEVNRWLDDIAVSINAQSQNIKTFVKRKIGTQIERILTQKTVESKFIESVPHFDSLYERTELSINRSTIVTGYSDQEHKEAMTYLVNNLYQTQANLQTMTHLELRLYLTALLLSKEKDILDPNNKLSRLYRYEQLKEVKQFSIDRLLGVIRDLKKGNLSFLQGKH